MALHRLKQSVLIITKYCEFESNPWYVVTSMCTLDIDSNFVNLRCTFVKIFLNSKKKKIVRNCNAEYLNDNNYMYSNFAN